MACNLVSQYVTHDLYSALIAKYEYVLFCSDGVPPPVTLSLTSGIFFLRSFTALDTHIRVLKDEDVAAALAAAPTKKKSRAADEIEDGDGKKRKAKTKPSQGVEKLKKANLSGMSKISSFFQKK
jgi:ribonuclease H2 subunit B